MSQRLLKDLAPQELLVSYLTVGVRANCKTRSFRADS